MVVVRVVTVCGIVCIIVCIIVCGCCKGRYGRPPCAHFEITKRNISSSSIGLHLEVLVAHLDDIDAGLKARQDFLGLQCTALLPEAAVEVIDDIGGRTLLGETFADAFAGFCGTESERSKDLRECRAIGLEDVEAVCIRLHTDDVGKGHLGFATDDQCRNRFSQ